MRERGAAAGTISRALALTDDGPVSVLSATASCTKQEVVDEFIFIFCNFFVMAHVMDEQRKRKTIKITNKKNARLAGLAITWAPIFGSHQVTHCQ